MQTPAPMTLQEFTIMFQTAVDLRRADYHATARCMVLLAESRWELDNGTGPPYDQIKIVYR